MMLDNQLSEERTDLTDAELIALFRNGDQTAFQQLAVRYMFVIRRKSADLFDKGVEADDLLQEGFLALHSAVNTYNETSGASFGTYAGVCIRNRLVSAVRSAGLKKNNVCTQPLSDDIPFPTDREPENALIIKEDLDKLLQYIRNSLSPAELQVLSLYLDGKSYDEISAALGISRKSCDNAMQRVRRKLRNRC